MTDRELRDLRDALVRAGRGQGLTDEQAEDLSQQTLTLVLTRQQAGERIDNTEAFARGILRNLANNLFRTNRRQAALLDRERATLTPQPDSSDKRFEARQACDALLGSLPERERAVFELKYQQGLSAPEIGRRLGLTARTVRRDLRSARETLARRLAEEGYLQ